MLSRIKNLVVNILGLRVRREQGYIHAIELLDWVIARGNRGMLVDRVVRLSASQAVVIDVVICLYLGMGRAKTVNDNVCKEFMLSVEYRIRRHVQ